MRDKSRERDIALGDIFKLGDKRYAVMLGDTCEGCAFDVVDLGIACGGIAGRGCCSSISRKDSNGVIYVEVEELSESEESEQEDGCSDNIKIERKIGEVFSISSKDYIVTAGFECCECAFAGSACEVGLVARERGLCSSMRRDGKYVVFKELKKGVDDMIESEKRGRNARTLRHLSDKDIILAAEKHSGLMIQWVDGVDLEVSDSIGKWHSCGFPFFRPESEYRVKERLFDVEVCLEVKSFVPGIKADTREEAIEIAKKRVGDHVARTGVEVVSATNADS